MAIQVKKASVKTRASQVRKLGNQRSKIFTLGNSESERILNERFANARKLQTFRARQQSRIKAVNDRYISTTQNVLNDKTLDFLVQHSNIDVPTFTSIFAGFELARKSRADRSKEARDIEVRRLENEIKLQTEQIKLNDKISVAEQAVLEKRVERKIAELDGLQDAIESDVTDQNRAALKEATETNSARRTEARNTTSTANTAARNATSTANNQRTTSTSRANTQSRTAAQKEAARIRAAATKSAAATRAKTKTISTTEFLNKNLGNFNTNSRQPLESQAPVVEPQPEVIINEPIELDNQDDIDAQDVSVIDDGVQDTQEQVVDATVEEDILVDTLLDDRVGDFVDPLLDDEDEDLFIGDEVVVDGIEQSPVIGQVFDDREQFDAIVAQDQENDQTLDVATGLQNNELFYFENPETGQVIVLQEGQAAPEGFFSINDVNEGIV